MREEITTTNDCLHDEVRNFAGVSALGLVALWSIA